MNHLSKKAKENRFDCVKYRILLDRVTGIKFLVPEYAAGAIIGKGGKNISEYRDKFDAFVKMSAGREFFPHTEERVCLITRDVIDPEQLTACFQYLCVLVREEPENNGRVRRKRDPERRNQVSFHFRGKQPKYMDTVIRPLLERLVAIIDQFDCQIETCPFLAGRPAYSYLC